MDREGFAKVSPCCRECIFSRESLMKPSFYTMAAIICGGCRKSRIVTSIFAKVLRKFRMNFAKVGVGTCREEHFLSHNYLTFILTLSLSLSLSLSQSFTSLCHSLSVSLFLTPPPSLSHSLTLAVCLSLSLSLSPSFSLAN